MKEIIKKYTRLNRFSILLIFALSFAFQSCESNSEPVFFVDVERDFEATNPLGAVVTHFYELKNIPTKLQQNLDVYGLSKDNIGSINPADALLTTAAGIMDWTLISSVEIYAISRLDPTNRKQIFFVKEPDFGSSEEIKLFNTFADMKSIMEEPTIDLQIRLTTWAAAPGNFRARLIFSYAVFEQI